MKRYLLFSGMDYYPYGGWSDFRGAFDSIQFALEYYALLQDAPKDWYQIVDTETMEIVSKDY